jgi:predicted enzyme related to lactoylglutathione lyase
VEAAVITGVSRVVLQVRDQDAAKTFWTETIGFDCLQDTTMGDERWVEVRPPDAGPVISLVPGADVQAAAAEEPSLPTSGVFFECDDIVATHQQLSARGVLFSQPPVKQFFGWWAVFEDPDGQRHALRQRGDEPLHA